MGCGVEGIWNSRSPSQTHPGRVNLVKKKKIDPWPLVGGKYQAQPATTVLTISTLGAEGVIQFKKCCLACTRPWLQSLASNNVDMVVQYCVVGIGEVQAEG